MTDQDHPVEVQGLVVGYGKANVLRGVDLQLPANKTTVLLGRNGSGKTTLLRTLMGLLATRAGAIKILGLDPRRERSRVAEQVGYVPDRPDLWPSMRVAAAARLIGAHHTRWAQGRFEEVLARFGVEPRQRVGSLSKGQGMKAMIAIALAIDPPLLLLDEPFGGLDPVARDEVLDEMIGALGERPRTLLLSTHETGIAARIGDHLVVLADGRLSPVQSMEAILHAPEGPRGADALGALLMAGVELGVESAAEGGVQ